MSGAGERIDSGAPPGEPVMADFLAHQRRLDEVLRSLGQRLAGATPALADGAGELLRELAAHCRVALSCSGELAAMRMACETELRRCRGELESAHESLQRAREDVARGEHAAALGRFAAGMASELNTPLAYIRANLEALSSYGEVLAALVQDADRLAAGMLSPLQWAQRCIDADRGFIEGDLPALSLASRTGLRRIERIIETLQRAAGALAEPRMAGDLGAMLHELAARWQDRLPPGVELISCAAGGLPVSMGPTAIAAALDEIVDNALRAMAGRQGRVVCAAGSGDGLAWIEVSDEGGGLAPALAEHVFEPFFSTREADGGVGLGLYLASETARLHGGSVTLASSAGAGTRVRLALPFSAPDPR